MLFLKMPDLFVEPPTDKFTDVDLKFLITLKKTRRLWSNEKQFSEIFEKMQEGKNLPANELEWSNHTSKVSSTLRI